MLRLFNDVMGGQASWLLPAALLGLGVGLWRSRHAPRTDRTRAALLMWGGWRVISGAVFSLGSGVIHTYYTVALAPAIAALVAIAARALWRARESLVARACLAFAVLLSAGWSRVLLDRTPHWNPWLRTLVLVCAVPAAIGLLAAPSRRRLGRRTANAAAVLALVACLAAPVAYSAQTVTSVHMGSVPSAGPSAAGGVGAGPGAGAGAGAPNQSGPSSALTRTLETGSAKFRWVAAVSGSQSAASLELSTGGDPVMAIGGFSNEGGNLTLAQFEQYASRGEIHYYIAQSNGGAQGHAPGGGGGFPPGGIGARSGTRVPGATGAGAPGGQSGSSSNITAWVKAHFKAETVGGQTVYDLTQPLAG